MPRLPRPGRMRCCSGGEEARIIGGGRHPAAWLWVRRPGVAGQWRRCRSLQCCGLLDVCGPPGRVCGRRRRGGDQNDGSSLFGSPDCKSAGGEALFLLQHILNPVAMDGTQRIPQVVEQFEHGERLLWRP